MREKLAKLISLMEKAYSRKNPGEKLNINSVDLEMLDEKTVDIFIKLLQ